MLDNYLLDIERVSEVQLTGTVVSVSGLLVECAGIEKFLSVGSHCIIESKAKARKEKGIPAEVVGFKDGKALLMPFSTLEGVGPGAKVSLMDAESVIYPSTAWLGRVINAMGEPVDGKGPLSRGGRAYPLHAFPPNAHERQRVKGKLNVGVRSMNTFLTACRGQRMGIFAGSGVGKSILMGMIARNSQANVNIIGLVGERGRELKDFLEEDLGEEGLKRAIVIVATSDEFALMRRQAAYLTMAVAEYFRDEGEDVLCMIDSVTRFAMAQREIGLSAGEPPTTKGYTPTVFAELPKLLERAGPGKEGQGSITGFFTVLVEGDDTNEPVSDTVRGILDGHIILDRTIAERGRYPAINVLRSVSRTMPACNTQAENSLIQIARGFLSTYEDMAEMIRLGAYRKGSDATVDQAIKHYPALEDFLRQGKKEHTTLEDGYKRLAEILGVPWPPAGG